MERNHSEKRLDYLKRDGSDLFLEGDIAGATEMYIAAMRLEMDQQVQKLLPSKQSLQLNDCNNNISEEEVCKGSSTNRNDGINNIINAVLNNAEEAIKVNPSLPKPYKSKATALLLQDKWDEAREVYLAGIKCCDECSELREALQKLQKTQTFLQSIPQVLERTRSVSSDTSESTFDGKSPTSKAKRFRLQHRKKLSRPMVGLVMTTSPDTFKSSPEHEQYVTTTDNASKEH